MDRRERLDQRAETSSASGRAPGGSHLVARALGHWRMMLGIFLVAGTLGTLAVLQIPRRFTAEAVLLVDPQRNQLIDGMTSSSAAIPDTAAINSEVSLFYLPQLALRVVRALDLADAAEYRPTGGDGWRLYLVGAVDRIKAMLGLPQQTLLSLGQDGVSADELRVVNEVGRRLSATNDPRSYLIRVSYTAHDPLHAAMVANAFADSQIASQREARVLSVRQASTWLNGEIVALQERVTRAEAAEQAYRRDWGLGDDKSGSLAQQAVIALMQQVSLAGVELSQAQAKLRQTKAGIVNALEEELRVAREREANIRAEFEKARQRLEQVQTAEAGLRPLMREVAASRVLLEDFMRRARSVDTQITAPRAESLIVSRAVVPTQPSGWGPSRLVPAVLLGSAGLAAAFGVLCAALQHGFRSASEVEHRIGLRVVGEIPLLRKGAKRIRQTIIERPTSEMSDAMRSMAATLLDHAGPCPIFQVTSPTPGDGKTMLATALAQAFALSGRNCLLVDADFRRPSVHRMLFVPLQPGLSEVVSGTATTEQVVARILPGPISFMSAGLAVADPLKLLASGRLDALMTQLRRSYDVIILDTPPVLPVSDARLIAQVADRVLLALRWNVTTPQTLARSLTLLRRHIATPPALVLTQIDRRRMSRFEEGGFASYASYATADASGRLGRPRIAAKPGRA